MGVQEPVEDKSGEEACEMAEKEAPLKFRVNEGKHRGSEWKHRKMFKEGRNEAADVWRRSSSVLVVLSHLRPLCSPSQRLKALIQELLANRRHMWCDTKPAGPY